MRLLGREVEVPPLVLVALVVTIAGALVVAAFTSTAAFGAYNPEWDGASDLRAQAEAVGVEPTIAREVDRYDSVGDGTVAVVLSPDESYTEAEAARVRAFVERGGTLVVAEDYGPHANPLLAAVGATARVDGRQLRDERNYYRDPALPVATNVTNATRAGTDELTLNYGTAVEPNGADVLIRSSAFGYLDTDDDDALDETETLSSYPVVTEERVGNGTVVVVGDPSALINAMLDRPGNERFVRGLFRSHDAVLLDYSHAARLPPLALALLVVRETPLVQALGGVLLVGLVALWGDRRFDGLAGRLRARLGRPTPEPPTLDETTIRAYIERRHPEWDDERVDRLVATIAGRRDDDSAPDEI